MKKILVALALCLAAGTAFAATDHRSPRAASAAWGHGVQLAALNLDAGKLSPAASDAVRRWPAAKKADPAWEWGRVLVFLTQTALIVQGYDPGRPDGLMGPKTIFALLAWTRAGGRPWKLKGQLRPELSYLWGIDDSVVRLLSVTLKALGLSPGLEHEFLGRESWKALNRWNQAFKIGGHLMPEHEAKARRAVQRELAAARDAIREERAAAARRAAIKKERAAAARRAEAAKAQRQTTARKSAGRRRGGRQPGEVQCLTVRADEFGNVWWENKKCSRKASVRYYTTRGRCKPNEKSQYPCGHENIEPGGITSAGQKAHLFGKKVYSIQCAYPYFPIEANRGIVVCVDKRKSTGAITQHPYLFMDLYSDRSKPGYRPRNDSFNHPDLAPYRPEGY